MAVSPAQRTSDCAQPSATARCWQTSAGGLAPHPDDSFFPSLTLPDQEELRSMESKRSPPHWLIDREDRTVPPVQETMSEYKQGNRQMVVSTPLGPDKLLLVGFEGSEQISGLFTFRLDLLAANSTKIEFDKLLGEKVVVGIKVMDENSDSSEPKYRHFGGICRRFSQGNRDDTFTSYQAEIVPQFWLLTRRAQSRIFQHMSVPDILKKVLSGLDVSYSLTGNFEKRDYCVQYRETDFNFASRLMEEEGIFYFFKHTEDGHKMVVGNSPGVHEDVPAPVKARWRNLENGAPAWNHIHEWQKVQEVRSGKFTLWDHCFERPGENFESKKSTLGSVAAGKVTHKLEVAGNSKLELYDYPGEFAQRFDGIDQGGGAQSGELGKISGDGTRTVELRMQAETVAALVIQGSSNCSQFTSGHKFTLEDHFDAEGSYVLTSIHHSAHGGNAYRTGDDSSFVYSNSFTCIPKDLPFRPQRTTPKPCVMGAQTATVVGPAGEEIFTDKYSRVKVQFHWDREGKKDADSSCWLRVGTPSAGKNWGMIHIPRIGQEVIVDFMEGDPDAPIVIGSVYNAEMMPPYKLPDNKTQSGLLTRSTKGGDPETFNELCFEDKKGEELVYLRAEKDLTIAAEHDEAHWVGHDREKTVDNNETITIHGNRTETVDKDESITISGARTESISKDDSLTVGKKLTISAGDEISITTGAASIVMKKDGTITIKGTSLTIQGSANVTVKGAQIALN